MKIELTEDEVEQLAQCLQWWWLRIDALRGEADDRLLVEKSQIISDLLEKIRRSDE